MVSASPLTRSSHHAGDDFARLRAARRAIALSVDAEIQLQAPGEPQRAPQMFDLVADVERYPEFVPLCRSLKIRQRRSPTAPRS